MKRSALHLMVFVAGALSAAVAWPQSSPSRRTDLCEVYQSLGLSAELQAEVKQLHGKIRAQYAAMGQKRKELYLALKPEQHDPAKVDALLREIVAIREKIQRDTVDHLIAIKPSLTAAQRETLFDRLAAGDGR